MQLLLGTLSQTQPQSPIALREYQKQMVAETYRKIRNGSKRILVVATMGAGKTVLSSWMLRDAASKGRRSVFLVALNVLLDQTANTLEKLGVHCTVLQGDRPVDFDAPVIIASLQTISARLRAGRTLGYLLGNIGLVVVDEAHITAFNSTYQEIEEHYSESLFVGLTATPWRLSRKEWLGQKFDALVQGPQPPEIIRLGGALPCRGYTFTGVIDLDNLHTKNGDYIDIEIASQACRDSALTLVVAKWQQLCNDRPTLMIGATVKQARLTCERFNKNGITAEIITGETLKENRLAIFDRVRRRQTQVICSVGALTAGFDLPEISAILYVRATKSKSLFFQSAGRGSRILKPHKRDYLLLDFGGNLKRPGFGNPMSFQNYNIDEPIKEENFSISPTKTCPQCFYECSNFVLVCPECGYEFKSETEDFSTDEDLPDCFNEFLDKHTREKIKNLRTWKKSAWLSHSSPDVPVDMFVQKYGYIPPQEWLIYACLRRNASAASRAEFVSYLYKHQKLTASANHWFQYHLQQEFGVAWKYIDNAVIKPWWEILECTIGATWQEIKKAYNIMALKYHPDVCREIDSTEKMTSINLAFEMAKIYVNS